MWLRSKFLVNPRDMDHQSGHNVLPIYGIMSMLEMMFQNIDGSSYSHMLGRQNQNAGNC